MGCSADGVARCLYNLAGSAQHLFEQGRHGPVALGNDPFDVGEIDAASGVCTRTVLECRHDPAHKLYKVHGLRNFHISGPDIDHNLGPEFCRQNAPGRI